MNRRRVSRVVVAMLGLVLVPAVSPLRAQMSGAACWQIAGTLNLDPSARDCVESWIDSLRSRNASNRTRARTALYTLGGRRAVDALRADYERSRSHEAKMATIFAMGTTGSPDDIAFLVRQLDGPTTGFNGNWVAIQAAASVLGLLRATSARPALRAAADRSEPATFAGPAILAALASLDRAPCAGTLTGDPEKSLFRIVMECGPESMDPHTRYADRAGGVWTFRNESWHLDAATNAERAKLPIVSGTVWLPSESYRAEVMINTGCGQLCGEGWLYRLVREGRTWRVVSAVMEWVS